MKNQQTIANEVEEAIAAIVSKHDDGHPLEVIAVLGVVANAGNTLANTCNLISVGRGGDHGCSPRYESRRALFRVAMHAAAETVADIMSKDNELAGMICDGFAMATTIALMPQADKEQISTLIDTFIETGKETRNA